jgi:mannose-6-phosphate isomerase-like protein (cupin superfamily)
LRAPLLERGIQDTKLCTTEDLWLSIKVYADGGENDLHAHPEEDHSFVVLQGQATFYDENGTPNVVNKYEGALIPKGALYRFHNTGPGNLVMLRAGAGVNPYLAQNALKRKAPDGKPMPNNPSQVAKGWDKPTPVPGKFFGDTE